jgi:shikimate dehydrogenase
MHQAALAHVGAEGDYQLCDVDEAGFLDGVVDIRTGKLDGANVTMPFKILAHDLSDAISDRAARVGAVNTLSMQSGQLTGFNTDVAGVAYAFEEAKLPATGPVVVMGAGGAAAAAQVALVGREIFVVARRPEQAESMLERLHSDATVIPWGESVPAGVVVNATSLGMRGEMLPEHVLDAATGLLDMAYGDHPTRSVAALRNRGLPVADGLDMLIGQAIGCFRIWTGEDVDPVVFRNAAEAELRRRSQEDVQC